MDPSPSVRWVPLVLLGPSCSPDLQHPLGLRRQGTFEISTVSSIPASLPASSVVPGSDSRPELELLKRDLAGIIPVCSAARQHYLICQ